MNKYLFDATPPTFAPTDQGQPRSFSGVAYSGGVIPNHPYWGNLAIDLASIVLPPGDGCPVLLEHDRGSRAGVCSLTVADNALMASGFLLENAAGQQIAQDADSGFPWQMSVHAEPGLVETVPSGVKVTVNGAVLPGPATIFWNTKIREVSFCVTGQDSNTSASVFNSTTGNTMTEEMLADTKARLEKVEAELQEARLNADTATKALMEYKKEARLKAVNDVFDSVGKKATESQTSVYLALSDDAWNQVASDLASVKAAIPKALFSEQAVGDPDQPQSVTLSTYDIYAARRSEA